MATKNAGTKSTGVHQLTRVIESLDEQIGILQQARALLVEGSEETVTSRRSAVSGKAPVKKSTRKPPKPK